MGRVNHFEVSADDPERASAFYREVFGWEIVPTEGPLKYWHIKTGPDEEPGINGGMFVRPAPMTGHVNIIGVDSVDEQLAKIKAAGGKECHPRMAVPGTGWLAYAQDTEGNLFGMMQLDPSAK